MQISSKSLRYARNFPTDWLMTLEIFLSRGVVPRFSDLDVIALSLTTEHLGIDSENNLFDQLKEYQKDFCHLISRCQFDDRRKNTYQLCEMIRKRIGKGNGWCREIFLCRFQTDRGLQTLKRQTLQDGQGRA